MWKRLPFHTDSRTRLCGQVDDLQEPYLPHLSVEAFMLSPLPILSSDSQWTVRLLTRRDGKSLNVKWGHGLGSRDGDPLSWMRKERTRLTQTLFQWRGWKRSWPFQHSIKMTEDYGKYRIENLSMMMMRGNGFDPVPVTTESADIKK